MGLLDIWSDWKKDNQSQSDGFEDYTSTNGGTLDTAGGMKGSGINATMDRKSESPLIKNPIFPEKYVPPGQGKIVINPDGTNKVLPNEIQMFKPENQPQGTPVGKATDPITQGGEGVKLAEDKVC